MAQMNVPMWTPKTVPLSGAEIEVLGEEAADSIAVELPVSQAQLTHVGNDGTLAFSAMFVFPPGFFELEGSRFMLEPQLAAAIQGCLRLQVVPTVRMCVRASEVVQIKSAEPDEGE